MKRKALLAVACTACIAHAVAAAPGYTVTPLIGKYGEAVALNQNGEVATNNHEANIPNRASLIGRSGSVDLGTLGGRDTTVYGINNKGEAVGISQLASGEWRGFLFSGGQIREFTPSRIVGPPAMINDRGDIAGHGYDQPFLYRDGQLTVLATTNSRVSDINEGGDVVGALNFLGQGEHPFLFAQGHLTDLGTLGGSFGTATGINDVDAVVGFSSTASEQTRSFLYQDGVMRALGGDVESMALGINNLGLIVGSAGEHAFLYRDGVMTDLNELVPAGANYLLTSAAAINDRGQILAQGCFTGNDAPSGCFGALLDPVPAVPEPSTLLMLMAGVCALMAVRRCR